MVSLVKNRRAISDYLEAPSIRTELQDVEEKYAAEAKERKKRNKAAAGEQHEEEESQLAQPEETQAEEPEDQMQHMMIGEESQLPIKNTDKLKGDKLEKATKYIKTN